MELLPATSAHQVTAGFSVACSCPPGSGVMSVTKRQQLRLLSTYTDQQRFEGVGVGDSSTARVQQISSYIQQQLQEQQPQAPAGTWSHPHAADEASCAASNHSGRSAGLRHASAATATCRTGSPSKAAAGRLAGSAAGSACSSPSRRRADLQFTPAVADILALLS
jgi:hypothetical protein